MIILGGIIITAIQVSIYCLCKDRDTRLSYITFITLDSSNPDKPVCFLSMWTQLITKHLNRIVINGHIQKIYDCMRLIQIHNHSCNCYYQFFYFTGYFHYKGCHPVLFVPNCFDYLRQHCVHTFQHAFCFHHNFYLILYVHYHVFHLHILVRPD